MADVGQEIYSGAASFGKLRATIGVIIGTLLGLGLIIGGIILLVHKTKRTKNVNGFPTDNEVPQCTTNSKDNNLTYQCKFSLSYTINGTEHTKQFTTNESKDYSGQTQIKLYYNPENVSDISVTQDNYGTIGGVLLGSGFFILIIAWVGWWLVNKYKFIAEVSGTSGAIQMFKNV